MSKIKLVKEAHGLSKGDKDKLKAFADDLDNKEIKRIIKFLVKSNVEVDKTQDVTKMKKEQLQKIVKEEVAAVLSEASRPSDIINLSSVKQFISQGQPAQALNMLVDGLEPLMLMLDGMAERLAAATSPEGTE